MKFQVFDTQKSYQILQLFSFFRDQVDPNLEIKDINVGGAKCLVYYEIGFGSVPVLLDDTPTDIYAPIMIPIDSLAIGDISITGRII